MRPLAILVFELAGAVACGGGAAGRYGEGGTGGAAGAAGSAVAGTTGTAGTTGGGGAGPVAGATGTGGSASSCIGIKPTASNTGVPAGFLPSLVTGDMTITEDGATIDGKDISGFLIIKASNGRVTRATVRGHSTPSGQNRGGIRIRSG